MCVLATFRVGGRGVEVLEGGGTILRIGGECLSCRLVGPGQSVAITPSKSMRGVRSRVESLYFMQRSVRAAARPRCANPRRASPGMCTDSERGGGRPGASTLSERLGGLGEGARLWRPVPAFAFTTLTDCNQVRFRVSISVGLLTVLISCLEKLWGTPLLRIVHGFRRTSSALLMYLNVPSGSSRSSSASGSKRNM